MRRRQLDDDGIRVKEIREGTTSTRFHEIPLSDDRYHARPERWGGKRKERGKKGEAISGT